MRHCMVRPDRTNACPAPKWHNRGLEPAKSDVTSSAAHTTPEPPTTDTPNHATPTHPRDHSQPLETSPLEPVTRLGMRNRPTTRRSFWLGRATGFRRTINGAPLLSPRSTGGPHLFLRILVVGIQRGSAVLRPCLLGWCRLDDTGGWGTDVHPRLPRRRLALMLRSCGLGWRGSGRSTLGCVRRSSRRWGSMRRSWRCGIWCSPSGTTRWSSWRIGSVSWSGGRVGTPRRRVAKRTATGSDLGLLPSLGLTVRWLRPERDPGRGPCSAGSAAISPPRPHLPAPCPDASQVVGGHDRWHDSAARFSVRNFQERCTDF